MSQVIWDGLFVGSFYALVALGYSMVYGVIKLLNFAHGDIYMIGAFVAYFILGSLVGAPTGISLAILLAVMIATMAITGTMGVVIERIAYRPLRGGPRLTVLITAVGVSFTLEYAVSFFISADPKVFPAQFQLTGQAMSVLGARVTVPQLVLMAVAAVLMILLQRYVMHSRDGRAMRAVALDPQATKLMGVNVDAIISRTFFIGSALAGAAGVMAGAYYGKIDFLMGFILGLKAFTAAVIGGIGSLYGAMLGGLVLGLLESFATWQLGGMWRDVVAFAILILFLSFKPTGILGGRVVERM
ncbi:MAG: branched-chain amino acid ABC transporter permease [Bifidobacteriaceae bacterium]|jgi:branched-chain amino acid transport system permease protein|nr:branched-chain amino acid ABC transporter permease [Bifidobacteriaceae bacterium]